MWLDGKTGCNWRMVAIVGYTRTIHDHPGPRNDHVHCDDSEFRWVIIPPQLKPLEI